MSHPNPWDEVASTRARQIELGTDLTFGRVFVPLFRSMVERASPRSICDVGCGTGHLLLSLADQADRLVGVDPSLAMYTTATALVANTTNISVYRCDATEASRFGRFDFVVAHLCAQAVDDLDVFFASLARLVEVDGHCVVTIPHPCFWNDYQEYIPSQQYSYMRETRVMARLSVRGETVGSVPYVHRPLSRYFSAFQQARLSISTFEEIYPLPEVEQLYGQSWKNPRFAMFTTSLRPA